MDLFGNLFKDKKVFITGDTGFKGSWLCIWLNALGAEVYGYSLPPKTKRDNFIKSNVAEIIHHVDGDVRDGAKFKKILAEAKPDIALHLAAQSLVLPSYAAPAETFETNIIGTVNFFEAVRQTPSVKVAVNITSDKCYQNNEWIWGYRESDPMGGNDPYSASKGCSELITGSYLKSFFSTGDCVIASARAGNVIGGGDWVEHRIVPDIFRAYFSNQNLVVRNPHATRPWQFVLEPLFGYLRLTEMLYQKGRSYSGGWNFGPVAGKEHSVNDVIQTMKLTIPELKFVADQNTGNPHEATLLKLDISKALAHLGWKPLLNFDETISLTAEGYLVETDNQDVYRHRLSQIKKYAEKILNK